MTVSVFSRRYYAVALAGGLVAMAKVGAWDHYLLEAFVAGSTLLQLAVFTAPGRLASALVLFGCVQPAIQLIAAPAGTHRIPSAPWESPPPPSTPMRWRCAIAWRP